MAQGKPRTARFVGFRATVGEFCHPSLSVNVRKKVTRQFDWTTRVLVLLRRYHSTGGH